jgi:hypothetical protein
MFDEEMTVGMMSSYEITLTWLPDARMPKDCRHD